MHNKKLNILSDLDQICFLNKTWIRSLIYGNILFFFYTENEILNFNGLFNRAPVLLNYKTCCKNDKMFGKPGILYPFLNLLMYVHFSKLYRRDKKLSGLFAL